VGIYKRTRQGALAVLILYIYYRLLVHATTIITCSYIHVSSSCLITHPHVFSLRPPCFLHMPWRHTLNLRYTCAYHVYTMRNSCSLTSSLTLTLSRLFPILLDRSSLYHMTSRSCAYLLSLFHCRLIIIILNPNPSPSLSTLLSHNRNKVETLCVFIHQYMKILVMITRTISKFYRVVWMFVKKWSKVF